ncbi:hypothetical protein [Flavobacterium sp. 3HN19-14]|uniref:hypothetical protein n=1 Tax=Flavobacterium sp. 3HN19-14 TaxID=3448133 RepID=UPI003EE19AA6
MKLKSILFILFAAVTFTACDLHSSSSASCEQTIGIGTTAVTGPILPPLTKPLH